jgi:hypothetical protein
MTDTGASGKTGEGKIASARFSRSYEMSYERNGRVNHRLETDLRTCSLGSPASSVQRSR